MSKFMMASMAIQTPNKPEPRAKPTLPVNHDIGTSSRILSLYLELESRSPTKTLPSPKSGGSTPTTPKSSGKKTPTTPKANKSFELYLNEANRPGYICIIGQKNRTYDGNTWYKIISSAKPKMVIHELQPGSPYELRLCSVYLVSHMLAAEHDVKQYLHAVLNGGSINGDWFKIDITDLLSKIETMVKKYDVLQPSSKADLVY